MPQIRAKLKASLKERCILTHMADALLAPAVAATMYAASAVTVGASVKAAMRGKIVLASILGCVITLQLGAFSVALETSISGITDLPFGAFVGLMQPIHLAIGLVEGLVTSAVLLFVYEARPELMINRLPQTKLIASHDLDMILDTCQRVILLSHGHIAADGDANTILRDKELLEANRMELPFCLQRK